MNCKFKGLAFGEIVSLSGGQSACGECGADTQIITESIQWIYQGHSGEIDLFEAAQLVYCHSCGTRISGYEERCGEMGGLQLDLEYVPKHSPIINVSGI